jgi:hypothetical protein
MKLTAVQIIKQYTELYHKYNSGRFLKLKEYFEKHNLSHDDTIYSTEHPDYFKINDEWEERRKIIDIPILQMAKYEINQELEFLKTNRRYDEKYMNPIEETVLSHGKVTKIKTSDKGNGEILYCFETLVPPCPESNPYCLEKNIIGVFKSE